MAESQPSFRFTRALSNKLRYRYTRYFRAYYKALRSEIEEAIESGADPDSIPDYYKGYKKVEVVICHDGILVIHRPAGEGANRDIFKFFMPPERPTVKKMSEDYNPPMPGGDTMGPLIEYQPGDHFGPVTYAEPRQRVTPMGDGESEVTVEDKWHRLDMVSWSRVHAFTEEADAKHQAKKVLATRDERRGPDAPNDLEGEKLVDPGEDPTDRLIREVLRTRQTASREEADRILERISYAPFMGEVRVPPRHRGLTYRGREVQARENSLFYHLAKRVDERQWAEGTSEEEYLEDLHSAALEPSSRLVLYELRGGSIAAVIAENSVPGERRGPDALDYLFVAYSADRATIITGYQVSSTETLSLSEDPLWLR